MTIESNKETDNPSAFQETWLNIKNYFFTVFIFIVAAASIYIMIPDDCIWIFVFAITATLLVGLMTEGSSMSTFKDFLIGMNIFTVVIGSVMFLNTPLETEKESMNIKEYIQEFKVNTDGDRFTLTLKLPFESIEEFALERPKFNKLFASKDHFNEFNITIEKTCNKYRLKGVTCSNRLYIHHKDMGDYIYNRSMDKSVYPKKFKLEISESESK